MNSTQIIQNDNLVVEVDAATLTVAVTDRAVGHKWSFGENPEGELRVEHGSTESAARLRDARIKTFSYYDTPTEKRMTAFLQGLPGGVELLITFALPYRESILRVEVDSLPVTSPSYIVEVRYPGHLRPIHDEIEYTVWPNGAGMLIPANHEQEIRTGMSEYETQVKGLPYAIAYSWHLYQPWWGAVADRSAYMAIAETPFDFALDLVHPSGGPTVTRPIWVPSLGHLAYRRAIRYRFYGKANYVTLAKDYRTYSQSIGRWVSLQAKIERNPMVEHLVGSVIYPISICRHNMQMQPPTHEVVTFARRIEQIRQLQTMGCERAYLHIDGWGRRGYDNHHPDILPPCSDAGGWEGLVDLSQTAAEYGYLFGLHDQYRDFYLDGPSYSEANAIKMDDGHLPLWSRWAGGPQSLLCAKQALSFLRQNYARILGRGIQLTASYLDVFAMNPLDECFDVHHPMTREDCYNSRAEAFDYIRSLGMVVSSEEPADCFIPQLDFAHWNGYPRTSFQVGDYLGIPVPLHNLVYHDALLLPGLYGYGQPSGRDIGNFLEALAQVEIPYGRIDGPSPADEQRVTILKCLHAAWGIDELVDHKLLDDTGLVQEYEYPQGKVTVDMESARYHIEGGPVETGDWVEAP